MPAIPPNDSDAQQSATSAAEASAALVDAVDAGNTIIDNLAVALTTEELPAPVTVASGIEAEDLEPIAATPPKRMFEAVLSRPWAILPEALIEFTARLAQAPQTPPEHSAAIGPQMPMMSAPTDPGGVSVIPLHGMITPRGSMLSMLFGGLSGLQCFRDCFRDALADDNVSAIVIDIDSPGGLIDLVPETAEEIRAARGQKPIVAVANTLAASAAYWIACQADELVVTPSGQVGSVGVFTVHEDFSAMEQMMGIKRTIVSAGQYKVDGNPYEPLSKSALAGLQNTVDDLYAMFVSGVAAGRGTSVQAVAAGYGQGRAVLADQALALKMVDRVETFEQTVARLGGVVDDTPDEATDMPDMEDMPDTDELTPQTGAITEPIRAQEQSDGHEPPDYLNGRALREQPAWSL